MADKDESDFPAPGLPLLFADGVLSISTGPVVKFYTFRVDPSINARGTVNTVVNAEIVMPKQGFIAMVHFFNDSLRNMVEIGHATEDEIAKMRPSAPAEGAEE